MCDRFPNSFSLSEQTHQQTLSKQAHAKAHVNPMNLLKVIPGQSSENLKFSIEQKQIRKKEKSNRN